MSATNSDEQKKKSFMQKRRIVLGFVIYSMIFYIASLIITIFYYHITDFSIGMVDFVTLEYAKWSTFTSNILCAILSFYLMGKLIKAYRIQRSEIRMIFIAYFWFSGLPALFVGLNVAFPFAAAELVGFFSISAFFLIPGATFFLIFLIIEIFLKNLEYGKNKLYLVLIGIFSTIVYLIAISVVFIGIGENIPGLPGILFVSFGLLFILINLWLYFLLAIRSFQLISKVSEPLYKRAFTLLGLGGITIGLIYVGRVVAYFALKATSIESIILNSIIDYAYLIGYVLLYLGITMPMKSK
jgi:hypothetical protein